MLIARNSKYAVTCLWKTVSPGPCFRTIFLYFGLLCWALTWRLQSSKLASCFAVPILKVFLCMCCLCIANNDDKSMLKVELISCVLCAWSQRALHDLLVSAMPAQKPGQDRPVFCRLHGEFPFVTPLSLHDVHVHVSAWYQPFCKSLLDMCFCLIFMLSVWWCKRW